jgi:uncharacterized paraquat-inducible protein A
MSARACEVYELVCHACHHLAVLPVAAVRENTAQCPRCGARLEIRWRAA